MNTHGLIPGETGAASMSAIMVKQTPKPIRNGSAEAFWENGGFGTRLPGHHGPKAAPHRRAAGKPPKKHSRLSGNPCNGPLRRESRSFHQHISLFPTGYTPPYSGLSIWQDSPGILPDLCAYCDSAGKQPAARLTRRRNTPASPRCSPHRSAWLPGHFFHQERRIKSPR